MKGMQMQLLMQDSKPYIKQIGTQLSAIHLS